MTLGLVTGFLGILLAYSAIRNEHPWCPVLTAFGKPCPPKPGGAGPLAALADRAAGLVGGQAVVPGTGQALVDAFWAAAQRKFPNVENAGVCACRHIIPHDGGTSDTWSEHSWCNAIDLRADATTMAKIMLWANVVKVKFKINNIIGPGSAVAVVHVDFLPSHAGEVPPCASGGT